MRSIATAAVRQRTELSDAKEEARRRPLQLACATPQVRVGQGFVTVAQCLPPRFVWSLV